jgi:hypothetical protein
MKWIIGGVILIIIVGICIKFKVNPILIIFEIIGEFFDD